MYPTATKDLLGLDETPKASATSETMQRFGKQDEIAAKAKAEYMPLVIKGLDDKEGEKSVHAAKMVCAKARTTTEKTRKALNKEAQEHIRKVNGEAKRITALWAPIEQHLQLMRKPRSS